jgi:hypothetical protein
MTKAMAFCALSAISALLISLLKTTALGKRHGSLFVKVDGPKASAKSFSHERTISLEVGL